MNMKSEKTQSLNKKTSALCAFVFEDSKELLGIPKLPAKLDAAVKQSIKETQGKFEFLSIIHTHQLIAAEKLVIAGLGKKQKTTTDSIRMVAGKIAQKVRELKLADFTIIVPEYLQFNINQTVSAIVEGAEMSMYSFDKYKKEKKEGRVPDLILVTAHKVDDVILKAKKNCRSCKLYKRHCKPSSKRMFSCTTSRFCKIIGIKKQSQVYHFVKK